MLTVEKNVKSTQCFKLIPIKIYIIIIIIIYYPPVSMGILQARILEWVAMPLAMRNKKVK